MTTEKQEQEFTITLRPTEEVWQAKINGGTVPLRLWEGTTAKGQAVIAHIMSIVPDPATEVTACILALQLPLFMKLSRETFAIDTTDSEATL
jgi:hypothetical protein